MTIDRKISRGHLRYLLHFSSMKWFFIYYIARINTDTPNNNIDLLLFSAFGTHQDNTDDNPQARIFESGFAINRKNLTEGDIMPNFLHQKKYYAKKMQP